jgi:hypothetical protein
VAVSRSCRSTARERDRAIDQVTGPCIDDTNLSDSLHTIFTSGERFQTGARHEGALTHTHKRLHPYFARLRSEADFALKAGELDERGVDDYVVDVFSAPPHIETELDMCQKEELESTLKRKVSRGPVARARACGPINVARKMSTGL